MIFITTGSSKLSSAMYDVVKQIDMAKKDKRLTEMVIAQIGQIEYVPQYMEEYFCFTDNIDTYIQNASIVITADGAGTVFDLLRNGKKIIVFVNQEAQKYGASATDFIGTLEEDNYLYWCRDITKLINDIELVRYTTFKKYEPEKNTIAEMIDKEYSKWLIKNVK